MCIPKKESGIGDWAEADALRNDIPSSMPSWIIVLDISSFLFLRFTGATAITGYPCRRNSFLSDDAFREKEKSLVAFFDLDRAAVRDPCISSIARLHRWRPAIGSSLSDQIVQSECNASPPHLTLRMDNHFSKLCFSKT